MGSGKEQLYLKTTLGRLLISIALFYHTIAYFASELRCCILLSLLAMFNTAGDILLLRYSFKKETLWKM